ncbi:type II secretion system F family protein [Kitasatospora sp. RB6PN24]|uniref:type II secretion system F family protein n=1 Tax=Kitasatospora humi TaxID=2893891 RepID=UPI001E60EBEF|nr:type II secretion system F family protein [Kitasatospora humi]MCC9307542.1 type II secretion system F family protein [Kitasatospora humi]
MNGRLLPLLSIALLGAAAALGRTRLDRRARRSRRIAVVLAQPVGGSWAARWAGRLPGRLAGRFGQRSQGEPWPLPRRLVPEVLLLPCGALAGWQWNSVVPLVGAAMLLLPCRRWRLRQRADRRARERAAAVIELCAALAAELRSGATPEQALDAVAEHSDDVLRRLGPEAAARLAAVRYGADVPAALRWLATLPGGGGANAIAACWQVTADSGSGLAVALDRVAEALRADRALREEVSGELAGPRTTAIVLAALPAVGLALGTALGAGPLRILLGTPLGVGCLVTGVLLEITGLVWTGRIVREAMADLGVQAGGTTSSAQRPVPDRWSKPPRPSRPGRRSVLRGSHLRSRRPGPGRPLERRRARTGALRERQLVAGIGGGAEAW